MTAADLWTLLLTGAGVAFFAAGTVGLLRFPDTASRLHALTKADNLGLGLVVLGLLPQAGSAWVAAKLLGVWALALLAAAIAAQLVARTALPAALAPRGAGPAAAPTNAAEDAGAAGRGRR